VVTVVDAARSNGHALELTDAEARQAAHELVRQAEAAGERITGTELGRRFGRSDRWGRLQIERARTGALPVPPPQTRRVETRRVDRPRPRSRTRPSPLPKPAAPSAERPATIDVVTMLMVGLVAAAASYGHMLHVAAMAGESLWIARLFPITVDGLVLIALRHRGREARWWLAIAVAVSIAANIAAAYPTLQGRLVAAWPPLALLGAHRLLHNRPTSADP